MRTAEKIAIFTYAEWSVQAGRICHDPEEKYENPMGTADLVAHIGTRDEVIAEARELLRMCGTHAYDRRTAFALLADLDAEEEEDA